MNFIYFIFNYFIVIQNSNSNFLIISKASLAEGLFAALRYMQFAIS